MSSSGRWAVVAPPLVGDGRERPWEGGEESLESARKFFDERANE